MEDELMSVAEIADYLGVTRQRVNQLMHQSGDFPTPIAELAIGRIWAKRDVERWSRSLHRRPGRRPAQP